MKKNKLFNIRDILYILMLCALLGFKSNLLYRHIGLAEFPPAFTALTAAIFLSVFALVSLVSKKAAKTAATVIYAVISVFMAIDAVYYSYASKLPSAELIPMMWQLAGISDTVENLVQSWHILFICDLPVLLIHRIDRDLLRRKLGRISGILEKSVRSVAVYGAAAVLCAGLAAFAVFFPGFEAEYVANEIFCYHMRDFAVTLKNSASDYEVDKGLYTYPDYSSSEYYGIAGGRNVIIIQVEAMQNFVIGAEYEGQEIMPNLNRLIGEDSLYFNNYYYQIGGGNTSDAEFAVNNSLFAPESASAYVKYTNDDYYGLPYLLKDEGYSTAQAFHGYIGSFWNRETAYPKQGFDDFTSLEDFEQTDMFPMGLSDKEMFRQSMEKLESWEEPFYAFYVTVSSHYPYGIPLKDREITLKPEDEGTLFGLYMQAMNYTDRAIGEFIEELKAAGLYDNSIIVIYGDHYALSNTDAENTSRFREQFGRDYTVYDVFNIPLIINIPGSGVTETLSVAGGHMDVLPTLLCLLGMGNDKAVMFGQNLLEAERGFVCEQTHLGRGSFISDEVFFSRPHNNIKSNYDAYAKGSMERLDPDLFKDLSDEAAKRISDCMILLDENDVLLD